MLDVQAHRGTEGAGQMGQLPGIIDSVKADTNVALERSLVE